MAKNLTPEEALMEKIVNNLNEIKLKCPDNYASYVADLTLRTISAAYVQKLFVDMHTQILETEIEH